MKSAIRRLFFLLFLASAAGCATTSGSAMQKGIIRQAENTPDTFSPDQGISLDENNCYNPMFDNRDNTVVVLVSSANGAGNYRVPEGKYGVEKGELLRIDCKTGIALGIVKE